MNTYLAPCNTLLYWIMCFHKRSEDAVSATAISNWFCKKGLHLILYIEVNYILISSHDVILAHIFLAFVMITSIYHSIWRIILVTSLSIHILEYVQRHFNYYQYKIHLLVWNLSTWLVALHTHLPSRKSYSHSIYVTFYIIPTTGPCP